MLIQPLGLLCLRVNPTLNYQQINIFSFQICCYYCNRAMQMFAQTPPTHSVGYIDSDYCYFSYFMSHPNTTHPPRPAHNTDNVFQFLSHWHTDFRPAPACRFVPDVFPSTVLLPLCVCVASVWFGASYFVRDLFFINQPFLKKMWLYISPLFIFTGFLHLGIYPGRKQSDRFQALCWVSQACMMYVLARKNDNHDWVGLVNAAHVSISFRVQRPPISFNQRIPLTLVRSLQSILITHASLYRRRGMYRSHTTQEGNEYCNPVISVKSGWTWTLLIRCSNMN